MVWVYLCDNCDHAGIYDINLNLMSFQTGEKVTLTEILNAFGDKIKVRQTKLFLPAFIEFQYGELNPGNKVHASVLSKLASFDLLKIATKEGACMPHASPLQGAKEEDKDKAKDKEKEKKEGSGEKTKPTHPLFEIWNLNRSKLPEALVLSAPRKKHSNARWAEKPDADYWTSIVTSLAASDFCSGINSTGWRADFDFLIHPATHIKVAEGKYKNKQISNNNASGWDPNL